MKNPLHARSIFAAVGLTVLTAFAPSAQAAPPDLTATGVIATIDRSATYNLGPTGLRGWIYIGNTPHGSRSLGWDGLQTGESRQILVTVASTPGSAVLAVDDVILGAMAGSSGTVPVFTSDARKAFGVAIGEAEKTGAGTLRVKRWRAGDTTDVNIPMTIMGDYAATAPYTCPKSTLILANARTKLVGQLLADQNYLTSDWKGAINGLALLAGVAPGDANYATVQTRLQTYARALAATTPDPSGLYIWDWGYIGVFLSEYYLSTNDAEVVAGVNNYTVALAKVQSRYGTYGHGGSLLKADGGLHGTIPPYGPVNMAGLPANLAVVMGKKALVAAGQAIDPEIDPAIQRGSDFFAYYVNKGGVPYGEHEPNYLYHGSNGKDPMCAMLFALQTGRTVETEFFTRMAIAGFNGREYGHTGQGFSYVWGAMGANIGGSLAAAEFLKPVRWHLDLSRRTDGSFAYDGAEQYGAGSTADGTYLGASGYYESNPTAAYILNYSLPLQRLYLTGKNANPANTLDPSKLTNAVAAGTFYLDCQSFTTTQLIAALSEFDPIVRNDAAVELATRTLTTPEVNTLLAMVTATNANERMGACQTLGILQNAAALPLLSGRLSDPDLWVRAQAAKALRQYDSATASTQRDSMLTAFTANATDPEVIVWSDPVQIANGFLSASLFGDSILYGNSIASYTINAPTNLLYPAVKAGLKQPDSYPRSGAAAFAYNYLTLADVQALIPDLIEVSGTMCQADTMWSASPRDSGIRTLAKYNIAEAIPLALEMQELPQGPAGWFGDNYQKAALEILPTYGDAARWTLHTLRNALGTRDPASANFTTLVNTIASIENAITAPTLVPGFAVANSQVVVTTGAQAITLTGTSPRDAVVTFTNVTAPAHGTLTGTAPNLIYTPTGAYTGPDSFTFRTTDTLTTSEPGTVSIIVGTAGTGLKGEYYDNMDFTNLKLTRTDAQVNFDWGIGTPNALLGADTFSVRWNGLLLVPETGTYTFSTLNSDGVNLYIDGVQVIDNSTDQSTHWKDSSSINLTAGQKVELQMEYFENTGSAVAKLKWTGPSFAGDNGVLIGTEWLYDATGVNRPAYAHAQSVTLVQNTPLPILLQGSGVISSPLTYSVVTPPSQGALSGIAPNLTYTPATNFSGSDSFTFIVNNGTGNSAPATVSIGIWAGLPVSYTWLAATSGNLNLAGNWVSGTAPAASGQPYYNLDFTPSGTYTVTHNLNNGFQLNQLNMGGAVTLAGTNSLAFTGNGPLLPQFNQNSADPVTINTPLNLNATTTFGGTGTGTVTISSPVTGTGGLTKSGYGTLALSGANTYSGGTVINSGTLLPYPQLDSALGSGPITLNGGTLYLEYHNLTNALIVNGGKIFAENGFGSVMAGPTTLSANLTLVNPNYNTVEFAGNISGPGGLVIKGRSVDQPAGTFILSGSNNYTGPTSVTSGTLICKNPTALGTGALSISTGAKVALNFTGTRNIASLSLSGTAMAAGTYGSTASPALYKNDTDFSGTGTVTVGGANVAPVATAQSVSTVTNTAKPITLTAADANGDPLTYSIVTQPTSGTLSGTAPNVIYTPAANFTGSASFTFRANDGALNSAPATVSITVTTLPVGPPVSGYSRWFDASQITGKVNNDPVTTWNDLSTNAANATVPSGNATPIYVANAGTESGRPAVYFAKNSGANTSAALSFTEDTAIRTVFSVFKGNSFLLTHAVGYDFHRPTDVNPTDPLWDASYAEARNGSTYVNGALVDGTTYAMPTNLHNGFNLVEVLTTGNVRADSFNKDRIYHAGDQYQAEVIIYDRALTEAERLSVEAYLTNKWLTAASSNVAPVASAQSVSVQQDTTKAITLTATDADNDPLTYAIVTQPVHGTLSGTAPNVIYTPAAGYSGADSFTFKANDGTVDSAAATVSITVTPPTMSLTGNGINSLNEYAGEVDGYEFTTAGGSSLMVSSLGFYDAPNGGSGTVGDGLLSSHQVSIWLKSNGSLVATALVVPADPLVGNFRSQSITPVTLAPNTSYVIAASYDGAGDRMQEGNNLSGWGVNGMTIVGGRYNNGQGMPTSDWSVMIGPNFGYTLSAGPPPNTAPVALAQSVATPEDTSLPITLTATDADGNPLTYVVVTSPTSGTLSGTAPNVIYTPNANSSGADSFTFKANDGTVDSTPATVSITVTAVNDAPTAIAQSVSTAEDTGMAITLVGSDVEGGTLTYTIVAPPASGTLSGTAPNVTYTPAANYSGAASFTFKVNDGTVDSTTATVSITITAVNDVPVFTANPIIAAGANEDFAYTGQTLAGKATDADAGDTITYSKVSGPAWLAVAANGTLTGTPPTGTAGLNSFVVRATDSASATADATLQITVTGLPLPWLKGDVGTGMLAGSTTYNAGTFTQAGSGIIGSTSDKLRFTYQTLTGDGEIIARISALQNTGTSSRVGVMIRDTLAANSKEIFMGMTGTNAYRWVRRTTTGGSTSSTSSSTGTVPNTWVRLVRAGATIAAYKSTNGTTWTSVGSTTNTTFAATCYIGLAVGSGSNTTLNTSQFSNLSVTP